MWIIEDETTIGDKIYPLRYRGYTALYFIFIFEENLQKSSHTHSHTSRFFNLFYVNYFYIFHIEKCSNIRSELQSKMWVAEATFNERDDYVMSCHQSPKYMIGNSELHNFYEETWLIF